MEQGTGKNVAENVIPWLTTGQEQSMFQV